MLGSCTGKPAGITVQTRTCTLHCTRTLSLGMGFHTGKWRSTLGYTRARVYPQVHTKFIQLNTTRCH